MPLFALAVPHTLTFCLAMFQLLSPYHRNCLDRRDDSGLSFCLKVIILYPQTSSPGLPTYPCCRHNPIVPHTPFSPARHILLFSLDCTSEISGDPAMGSRLLQGTVLALSCKLTYIYAESIHTQAAFGIDPLHLVFSGCCHYKCQACQIKSKRFLLKGQGCDCLRELIVGTSLLLSKISDSLSSETSEHVAAYNSHKTSWSFITLLLKAVIVTDRAYERKYRAYLVLWSLCCSRIILRMWDWERSVCLQLKTQTSCFKPPITLTRYETEQPTDANI
jgi:hypothetical protein